jgi:hypothetical protein
MPIKQTAFIKAEQIFPLRTAIALHEAGHAIVAVRLGFDNVSAKIVTAKICGRIVRNLYSSKNQKRRDVWKTRQGEALADFLTDQYGGLTNYQITRGDRVQALCSLVVTFSGIYPGKLLHHPWWHDDEGADDEKQATKICEEFNFDAHTRQSAKKFAKRLVTQNLAVIQKLALQLERKSKLNDREIRAIIEAED